MMMQLMIMILVIIIFVMITKLWRSPTSGTTGVEQQAWLVKYLFLSSLISNALLSSNINYWRWKSINIKKVATRRDMVQQCTYHTDDHTITTHRWPHNCHPQVTTTDSSTNFFVVLKLFFIMGPLWLGIWNFTQKKLQSTIVNFSGEFFSHLFTYRYGHENTFAIRITLDLLPIFSVSHLLNLNISNWKNLWLLSTVFFWWDRSLPWTYQT